MEYAAALIIGLLAGALGYGVFTKPEPSQPDVWPAKEHSEVMKRCAQSCGYRRMETYDMLYGRCKCSKK